jgi:hypothetical protein
MEIAADYTCPITLERPVVPVKTPCGHIFERDAVVIALIHNPHCPLCRAPATENDLQPLAARVDNVAQENIPAAAPVVAPAVVAPDLDPVLAMLIASTAESASILALIAGQELLVSQKARAHEAVVDQKVQELLARYG